MKFFVFFLAFQLIYSSPDAICQNKITGDRCGFNYRCNEQLHCVHDNLLPLSLNEIIGWSFILIIVGISTVAGIGGGIEKIPIMMMILNYDQYIATHLVQATMFGCNVTNYFLLIPQRHPQFNKPIIDYDIALVLLPTVIMGTDIGMIIHSSINEYILLLINFITMTILIPLLINRLKAYKQKEIYEKTSELIKNEIMVDQGEYMKDYMSRAQSDFSEVSQRSFLGESHKYLKYANEDRELIPKKKLSFIFGVYVVFELFIVMRGGDEFESLVQYGSFMYWSLTVLIYISLITLSLYSQKILSKKQVQMVEAGYETIPNKFIVRRKKYLVLWMIGFMSSLMGGLTGLGSGSILVSLLINCNIEPRVAAATSGFVKVLISVSSLVIALLNNWIPRNEALFFTALGVLGTLFITYLLYQIINEKEYQYPYISIVIGFLVLNAFTTLIYTILNYIIEPNYWNPYQ